MRKNEMNNPLSLLIALIVVLVLHDNLQAFQDNQPSDLSQKRTVEPVFRVSKLNDTGSTDSENLDKNLSVKNQPLESVAAPEAVIANATEPTVISPATAPVAKKAAPHPLDQAIQMAYDGLEHMRSNVFDYKAILIKREQVKDKVSDRAYMQIKIRNGRETETGKAPFSIYMKFLKPRAQAGREVIWVDGQNQNKLCAHESGLMSFKRFNLDPDGYLAMMGNKYPIYEAGLENLIIKLIEKAERDRGAGDCHVRYRENAKINGRPCTMIEVVHDVERQPYEFHKAQVFIDNELKVPVRYVAYDWPVGNQAPKLLEEYTYINIELNVGLTDNDFCPDNPAYRYPK